MRNRLLLLLAFLAACRPKEPPPAQQASEAPPEFIDEPFETLYPLFLLRKLKPGPKAALWTRY